MPFESLVTYNLGLPYFSAGGAYSAEADMRRFLYLDYNLKSYVGVIGVGIIDGWEVTKAGGLTATVGYGTAIINDAFSESPFLVKDREDISPTEYVIDTYYFIDFPAAGPPPLEYDPEFYPTPPEPPDTTTIYDKVLYSNIITFNDDSDNYLYIYRNSASSQEQPYYIPNNDAPVVETSDTFNPYHTVVAFGITASLSYAQGSGRALIAKVVTRNGEITQIDTSDVKSIKNLEASILAFGQSIVNYHRHGGGRDYDPQKVNLTTDFRDTVLVSSNDQSVVYQALYYEPTSIDLGHKHYYSIDADGNGTTSKMLGGTGFHYHTISEFILGQPSGSVDPVESHTHTITLDSEHSDPWETGQSYQLYINGEAYYGSNATVDAVNKNIRFTDDVTVKKRKYSCSKTFSDGTYYFEYEDKSVYRFMLRMALDYYSKNMDAIADGIKSPIILPDPETPITDLENQCITAEEQLKEKDDKFIFSGSVAPDPVTILLVEPGHVDEVQIEITANSEVTGQLRAQNILYISAEKFMTGIFEIGRIPILSHMGRYLEECKFTSQRTYSYDGYIFQVDKLYPWGNSKFVYCTSVDESGNFIIGTSDGLYIYPANGAYLFIINGSNIITEYGDLYTMFKQAGLKYEAQSGKKFSTSSYIYTQQIEEAEKYVSSYGGHYKMTGTYTLQDGTAIFDTTDVYRIEGYKAPNFGYTTTKVESEISQGEEIIAKVIPVTTDQAVDSEESEEPENVYVVKNDFNRSTVKKICVEKNRTDVYGGLDVSYYTLTSDFLASCTNPMASWSLTYQSGLLGYISEFFRTYRGYYVLYGSDGIYVCTNGSSAEYKKVGLPSFSSQVYSASFGYGDRILVAYDGSIHITDNYGVSWTEASVTESDYIRMLYDTHQDVTSFVNSHYHRVAIDIYGNGNTDGVYNGSGVLVPGDDHIHLISAGEIREADGHTHTGVRTYYAVDKNGRIQVSDDCVTWAYYGQVPSVSGGTGTVFVAFGKLFVAITNGLMYTEDGSTWVTEETFESTIYSSDWNEDNSIIYLGGYNAIYSFDGTSFVTVKTFDGVVKPSVYVDSTKKNFGYVLNNYKGKIDFYGVDYSSSEVDITYEFDKCYPTFGQWSSDIAYDLYVNDKMVKSTREGVIITGETTTDVNSEQGYVNFGVSTSLASPVDYGAQYIDVSDGSRFPNSGYIQIISSSVTGSGSDSITSYQDYIFKYYGVIENRIYLTFASQYKIPNAGIPVKLLSTLGDGDNVLITIYEGKIINVGENTHYDIEDKLSIHNIGSQKSFADVYLSNLMHMTAAIKYAISAVGSDYANYFLSMFDYNNIPGDENNIHRFIDISNSDLYSQLRYSSTFYPTISTKIYRIIFGFGAFADTIFVSTDIGFYAMKTDLGYKANWFRIDVDGSKQSYDCLQAKASQLFVITEKGLYGSSDAKTWTKYNEDVIGGLPLRITPRWNTVSAYNTGEYWWQGFNGVTHSNQSLINSLIVSGQGFCTVTDDYGNTWQKSYIAGANDDNGFIMTDPVFLHNGSVLACVRRTNIDSSSVISTATTGVQWTNSYTFVGYTANVTGYSRTTYGNIKMDVTYTNNNPPDNLLRGYSIFTGKKKFSIIDNSSNTIIVFGTEIVDYLVKDPETGIYAQVSVSPLALNTISELPQGNVVVGTDNGIFTDNGITLSAGESNIAIIKDVGVKATVASMNIQGKVLSTIFTFDDKTMISVSFDKTVKSNELSGYILKATGFEDRQILNNESTNVDGLTNVYIQKKSTELAAGVKFYCIKMSGELVVNRAYVSFDSYVLPGDVNNGMMYIAQTGMETVPQKEDVAEFQIVGNGYDYVDFTISNLPETLGVTVSDLFIAGTSIYCTLKNKRIPIYIDVVNKPAPGAMKNYIIELQDVSNNLKTLQLIVLDNTENILYVANEVSGVTEDSNGNTSVGAYFTYNCVAPNNNIYFKNSQFVADKVFNFSSSTEDIYHRHDVSIYGKSIIGTISSIGDTSPSYVDLNIAGASGLSSALFSSRPTLLGGQRLIAYDPDNFSSTFVLTVISTGSDSIRVKNIPNTFNLTGTDSRKVSAGYNIYMDASFYGVSEAPVFTNDFVVSRQYLSETTYVKGMTFHVQSTSGFYVGSNINIKDRGGSKFSSTIASIVDSTSFTVEDESTFDFYTENNSYCEIMFTNLSIGKFNLTSDSLLGTTTITVSSTSTINEGDRVVLSDNEGLLFSSTVSTILSTVSFAVEDAVDADFRVVNGANCIIKRSNYFDDHIHVIKNGEFSVSENSTWNLNGYSYYHAHIVSPPIKSISDIKVLHGKSYVVGNSSKIYSSTDSGINWREELDLTDVEVMSPSPTSIYKIASNSYDILFATNSGYIACHTTNVPSGVVPLENPIQ